MSLARLVVPHRLTTRVTVPRASGSFRPLLVAPGNVGIATPLRRLGLPNGIDVPRRPLLVTSRFYHSTPLHRAPAPAPSTQNRTSHTNDEPNANTKDKEPDEPDAKLPLTQRLRVLIKKYGWYALGMYITLSTLDFSVAFGAIYLLGAEHVSRVTGALKKRIVDVLPDSVQDRIVDAVKALGFGTHAGSEPVDHEEGQRAGGKEGFYTMLVLAWGIHKTLFLPVRVGLTAAFTPRMVRWLQRKGWAGKEGAMNAARQMRNQIQQRSSGAQRR